MKYKLDQIVYHKRVYNYLEPLKVVGIRANELELEGDYSGGVSEIRQKSWLPIGEVSTIYDYDNKKEFRTKASDVQTIMASVSPLSERKLRDIIDELSDMVLYLTKDIEYHGMIPPAY